SALKYENVVKEKAIGFAMLLSIEGFKASDGWITKFKKKYNLREYMERREVLHLTKLLCRGAEAMLQFFEQ
ncbi:6429_t:CDS:1, partial [Paraglomus occultum]